MSVDDACGLLQFEMERTWQRLPVSFRFSEPIPLHATIEHKSNQQEVRRSSHDQLIDAFVDALNVTRSPVLLHARPGAGKTSACKWLARCFAKSRIEQGYGFLPVYIDLGQVGHELPSSSLSDVITAQLQRTLPIPYSAFASEKQHLLFILDGLDLLSGSLTARRVIDEAYQMSDRRFVIAGRHDPTLGQSLQSWPETTQISLGVLNETQRVAWVRKFADSSGESQYHSLIRRNPQISTLLETPLLFAMTLSACIDAPSDFTFSTDQYSGKTGIFAGFVRYAISRAIWQGNIQPDDEARIESAMPFFQQLCLNAIRLGHADRIHKSAVPMVLAAVAESGLSTSDWTNSRSLLVAIGILEETPESYRFLHQQFAEHFAGVALATQLAMCQSQLQLKPTLGIDLTYRNRDPIVIGAISVIASETEKFSLLDHLFELLCQIDIGDACSLFANTASPSVVKYLVPIPARAPGDPMLGLIGIESLANIPHELAVTTLNKVISNFSDYPDSLVKAAALALGKSPMRSAKLALQSHSQVVGHPKWLTLALVHAFGDISPESKSLVREVALNPDELEYERTTAIEVLGEYGDGNDEVFLESFLKQKRLSLALHLNAQSALAKLRHRLSSDGQRQPVAQSLYENPDYEVFWAVQPIAKAFSRVDAVLGSVLPDIFGNLPISELDGFINSLFEKAELPISRDFVDRVVRLCTQNPRAWELIRRHPKALQLPNSLLQSCARVAGRRWIPWFRENLNDAPHTDSKLSDNESSHRPRERLDAEVVMTGYLKQCREQGINPTLDQAAEYSNSIGQTWSRSKLHKTNAWKFHMSQSESRRQQFRDWDQ